MSIARCWGEVVEPLQLARGELDAVGGGVLLDAGDSSGAGDGGDVVALGEDPGQCGLGGGGADLGPDGADLVHDGQVPGEVLAGEPWVGLAPVVVGEVVDGADLAGEQPVPERGVRDQ